MAFTRQMLPISTLWTKHLDATNLLAHTLDDTNPVYATQAILETFVSENVGRPGSYSLNIIPDVDISDSPEGSLLAYEDGMWVDGKPYNVTDVQLASTSIVVVDSSTKQRYASYPNTSTSSVGLAMYADTTDSTGSNLASPAGLKYQMNKTIYHRLSVITNLAEGRWYLDSSSGTEYQSGEAINVTPGSHTIHFVAVSGYTKPSNQTVIIADSVADGKHAVLAEYTPLQGTLRVLMNNELGRWSPDDGTTWYESSDEVKVTGGSSITVTFSTIGSSTPASRTILVAAGDHQEIAAYY